MSYKVSQLRKKLPGSTGTYMQSVEVSETRVYSDNPFKVFSSSQNNYFIDFALSGNFYKGNIYYLRGQILRVPQGYYSLSDQSNKTTYYENADDLTFTLLLANVKNEGSQIFIQSDYQQIQPSLEINRIFRNPDNLESENSGLDYLVATESQKWYHFQLIFSPRKNYTHLVFKMARNTYDLLGPIEEQQDSLQNMSIYGQKGRHWLLEQKTSKNIYTPGQQTITVNQQKIKYTNLDGDICLLKNIAENTPWKKFGIQARPGTLIVVQDEPIYIGRSGIYELNNGMEVTNFMITAPNGDNDQNIDAFLLDYMYEQEEQN